MIWSRLRSFSLFVVIGIMLLSAGLVSAQEPVTHTIASGENLFRIALKYGVTMDELIAANGISDPTRILAGQTLTIPGLSVPGEEAVVENPLIAAAPVNHTIARGETLSQIARRYNLTVEQILQANNIANPNQIEAGQTLQIWSAETAAAEMEAVAAAESSNENAITVLEADTMPTPITPSPTPAPPPAESSVHVVKRGEYLSGIARAYGISWTTIAAANNIANPDSVYAGMELIIPATDDYVPQPGTRREPGPKIGVGREIVIILQDQMVYAYEDGQLKHSALSSTGLPATPTVQGDFTIWHKTESQTMSGPGYYLPGVEWVMYFYQGYGLHGTYWHNNFGAPMSHGCVNLTNDDARWFYNFADYGTPVHVRYSA